MISAETKDFGNFIDSLKSKENAETGLLIGYKYQEKFYIYLYVKTPVSEVTHKQVSALLTMNLSIPGAVYSD